MQGALRVKFGPSISPSGLESSLAKFCLVAIGPYCEARSSALTAQSFLSAVSFCGVGDIGIVSYVAVGVWPSDFDLFPNACIAVW